MAQTNGKAAQTDGSEKSRLKNAKLVKFYFIATIISIQHMMVLSPRPLILLVFLTLPMHVFPQLRPSAIIQDGMVVQREMEIPLWGTGDPGQQVKINFNGHIDSTLVDTEGNWYIQLDAMPAGGPFSMQIASGNETISLMEVYVGDVWIASGQSNMAWTLASSLPPDGTIDTGNNPEIRHFTVQRRLLEHPSNTLSTGSQWRPAYSEYTGNFSAVAYYFSVYLNAATDIPIGIINASFGGTRIETWMSKSMLGFGPSDITLSDGQPQHQPTMTYNAMLHPIRNVRAKGIIWYQGEANAGNPEDAVLYASLLKKMITSWRTSWNMEDLPFLWVQLPNFGNPANEDQPGSWGSWPLMRRSQSSALELPRTGEVIAIDLGGTDIHPVDKQPVGERLSRIARQMVYGEDIPASGPRYLSHRLLADGKVEISFENIAGGLVARGTDDNRLKWFSIVKSNGSLVRANAVIDSNKVIVWNSTVSEPYAIRYAWESNPADVNFYNSAGLPAAPFYLYVADQGFSIKTFTAGSTQLDRGESTILRWEVFGAATVTLNDQPVDSMGAMRVIPHTDSVFTLNITQRDNPGNTLEKTLRVNVRQPVPTIELSAEGGEILPLDSAIHISSKVSAEAGAPVNKVQFYVNDQLGFEDISAPWDFDWIADTTGMVRIHAVVWNEMGDSSVSNDILLDVRELTFQRYEAENARFSGVGRVMDNETASNGQYLELMIDWRLDFDSVMVYEDGPYLIYIRYLLNYGFPKAEFLLVNDSLIETVLFEAPDRTTWMDYRTTVLLDSGSNKISMDVAWDYMSFDYLSVGLDESIIPVDTIRPDTTGTDTTKMGTIFISGAQRPVIHCYPNPFSQQVSIHIDLPEGGMLMARIIDPSGRTVSELFNGTSGPGRKTFLYIPGGASSGILFLQVMHNGILSTRKLVIQSPR